MNEVACGWGIPVMVVLEKATPGYVSYTHSTYSSSLYSDVSPHPIQASSAALGLDRQGPCPSSHTPGGILSWSVFLLKSVKSPSGTWDWPRPTVLLASCPKPSLGPMQP